MGNYRVRAEDADAFARSGILEKYQARIDQIAQAFSGLNPEDQKACQAFALKYLVLDDERNSRQKQGLADDDDIFAEQQAEMPEIEQRIIHWFPFIAQSSGREKDDYILAYIDYMGQRRKAQ